jgi:hypothetical protein
MLYFFYEYLGQWFIFLIREKNYVVQDANYYYYYYYYYYYCYYYLDVELAHK